MEPDTPENAETNELLAQARAGHVRAFDQLLDRYRSYLIQMVKLRLDPRLQTRVDASDVVQEAQLEASRRMDSYLKEQPMPFRLWLRQLVHDRLLMLQRSHVGAARRTVRREVALPEQSSLMFARQYMSPSSTPSEKASRQELVRQVRHALAGLSEADREILLMRTFEGLSFEEVALMLGIEPPAARKRHGRALLRLHKLLSEAGLRESQS
jgi:RNA polymerase sigma-70 factor (ECF subfamily)